MSKPSDSIGTQYSDVGKKSTSSTSGNNTANNQQRKTTPSTTTSSTVKQTVPVKGKQVVTPADPKKAANVPTRTSSAPPDEHPSQLEQKPHFQPTKTHDRLLSTAGEQSYSKAVKNELKEGNTQAVKSDAEETPVVEPEHVSTPAESSATTEVSQMEETFSAMAIEQSTPTDHQSGTEGAEQFDAANDGNYEQDGSDTTHTEGQEGGGNYSGGYKSYSQGDYRNRNGMNRGRSQQNYNNNANRTSNRPNNQSTATMMNQQAAVPTSQYYMDPNTGACYMYYAQYGSWVQVDPRYFSQYNQYQYQQYQYYPNVYQYQYAQAYPQQQQQVPRTTHQTNYQVPVAAAAAPAGSATTVATTAPQGNANVATPSKTSSTVDEPAQVEATVASPAVVDEPPTRPKPKLNIKNKDGTEFDISKLKKPVETPVETAVESTPTDGASGANKKEELTISTDVFEVNGPASSTPLSIPDIPVSVQRSRKVKTDVVESTVEESAAKDTIPEVSKKEDFVDETDVNVSIGGNQEQSSNTAKRLVPGGTAKLAKLNQGPIVKRYTKAEILSLKPAEDFYPKSTLLGVITVQGESSSAPSPHKGGGRDWQKGQQRGGRDGRENLKISTDGQDGWAREAPLPPQSGGRKGKGGNGPATPVPKKVVTDPMELLTQEVLLLLNKITPQTYEKLSKKFLELNIQNTAMLDKLVEMIFEIAISQPAFNALYADLCLMLKEQATQWVFYTVVKNNDTNDFFWVRDVVFSEEVVGPFYSKSDCLSAVTGDQCPPLKQSNSALNDVEYVLAKNILIKVGHTMNDAWFATYIPFDEINEDLRGQSFYPTENDARKDASSSVSFRGRLAHSCEKEFERSVTENNTYDKLLEELNQLRANRASMSPEEFEQKQSDIEERRFKIKRRMLGNIRFVGELYKTKLLNTDTMHSCIVELLGNPNQWKVAPDEQDLELLCNLLKTVGDALESKSKKMKNKTLAQQFDQYFDRLLAISKDKNFSSRIRFGIEEVITLRENNWQARRVQEGPLKLSEIHQKVQEEQTAKPAFVNKPQTSSAAPQSSSRSILSRTGDARNISSTKAKEDSGSAKISGGGASNKETKPVKSNQAPAIPDKIEFTDASIRRVVGASLDEYFSGIDISELKASIQEGSPLYVGYLVQEVLDKYFNTSKNNILTRVLPIFDDADISNILLARSKVVEVAIETFEPLKVLVDTSLDFKEAPERAGAVIGKLIKRGVLQFDKVKSMIDGFKQYNIDQDYNLPEDIESIFNRLLQALSS